MNEIARECVKCSTIFSGRYCKICRAISAKAYAAANRPAILEQKRARYENKRDEILSRNADWVNSNRERYEAYQKEYYKSNKLNILFKARVRYVMERYKYIAKTKAYVAANQDKVLTYYRTRATSESYKNSASYISVALRMKMADCPQELIDAKRSQLEIYRLTKLLTEALIEASKGETE